MDQVQFNPVHIAGMQTRATDILHGTFRAEMKLEGYSGGSCASFFWYHNDVQELDIEVVTPGTSIVNDTINYTTQPSTNADWSRIPNATLSIPLEHTLDTYRTHRFDCDATKGVKYYLDDKLMHEDHRNNPREGGSLQLKLWADGNKWWSGMPSTTDTFLRIKSIIAYYNTTTSLSDRKWTDKCAREKQQCVATIQTEEHKKPLSISCADPHQAICNVPDKPASVVTPSTPQPVASYTGTSMPIAEPAEHKSPASYSNSPIQITTECVLVLCIALAINAM